MGEAEDRFSHLLKPAKDLVQNWNIDVAAELERYLTALEDEQVSNSFAHAALVLQSMTTKYSKKVEYLLQLAYQSLDQLSVQGKSDNQKQITTTRHRTPKTESADDDFFCVPWDKLGRSTSSASSFLLDEASASRKLPVLRRIPLCLLPRGDQSMASRLSTLVVHPSGALLLDERDASLFNAGGAPQNSASLVSSGGWNGTTTPWISGGGLLQMSPTVFGPQSAARGFPLGGTVARGFSLSSFHGFNTPDPRLLLSGAQFQTSQHRLSMMAPPLSARSARGLDGCDSIGPQPELLRRLSVLSSRNSHGGLHTAQATFEYDGMDGGLHVVAPMSALRQSAVDIDGHDDEGDSDSGEGRKFCEGSTTVMERGIRRGAPSSIAMEAVHRKGKGGAEDDEGEENDDDQQEDPWEYLDEHQCLGKEKPLCAGRTWRIPPHCSRTSATHVEPAQLRLFDRESLRVFLTLACHDSDNGANQAAGRNSAGIRALCQVLPDFTDIRGAPLVCEKWNFGLQWAEFEDVFETRRKELKQRLLKRRKAKRSATNAGRGSAEGAVAAGDDTLDALEAQMIETCLGDGDLLSAGGEFDDDDGDGCGFGYDGEGAAGDALDGNQPSANGTHGALMETGALNDVERALIMAQKSYADVFSQHIASLNVETELSVANEAAVCGMHLRVSEWRTKVDKWMREVEDHGSFDFMEYRNRIVERVEKLAAEEKPNGSSEKASFVGFRTSFQNLAAKQKKHDVSRLFLTALILANQSQTKLHLAKPDGELDVVDLDEVEEGGKQPRGERKNRQKNRERTKEAQHDAAEWEDATVNGGGAWSGVLADFEVELIMDPATMRNATVDSSLFEAPVDNVNVRVKAKPQARDPPYGPADLTEEEEESDEGMEESLAKSKTKRSKRRGEAKGGKKRPSEESCASTPPATQPAHLGAPKRRRRGNSQ